MKKKVIVGLSGGVDSSVAAYLLKEQGYDVIGVTMQMSDELSENIVEDAARVATTLEIPFMTLDFRKEFKENVITDFISEYRNGRTPNPCTVCNRKIKWEALISKASELGADYIATGHYARIEKLKNGRFSVRNSISSEKDQTYVLYSLSQEQLSHTLMPVGQYSKDEIRNIARKIGISVADKPDSMEICFIPDHDYAAYIEKNSDYVSKEGNFVDKEGNILGKHKGIIHYTIGQRKGLGISLGHPAFVTDINPKTNEITLGSNQDLFKTVLYVDNFNFMSEEKIDGEKRALAKIRYSHKGASCTLSMEENRLKCVFDEPQRAITPGQSVVIYDGEYVFGGGVIC